MLAKKHPARFEMERKEKPRAMRSMRFGLFMVLLAALLWELVARPCLALIFPDAPLPDSFLKEILGLCLTLAGL